MIVGVCQLRLYLPGKDSLKEKRQVVKSILQRLSNEFGVSAAEVGEQDRWQTAVLGLSYVSNQGQHANEVLSKAVHYIERSRPDVEILDYQLDLIDAF